MTPRRVILHCSDSPGGTISDIDDWHRTRGFSRRDARPGELRSIGYHYVITNGRPMPGGGGPFEPWLDGAVWPGRHEDEEGAHALGENGRALGICLIGRETFTDAQFAALLGLVLSISFRYDIASDQILGHRETDEERRKGLSAKTCPTSIRSHFGEPLRPCSPRRGRR